MVELMQETTTTLKPSIFVGGVLFDLDLYWWKGWVQLRAEDLNMEEGELPSIIQLGKKRLLKPDAFKDFALIESRARTLVDTLSYPFMISSIKFVPYSVLPQLVEELALLKKAFDNFLEIFLFYYDENKIAYVNQYPQYAKMLFDKYPNSQEIRWKFDFSWKLFEMSMPTEIRAELVEGDELERLQNAWNTSQDQVAERLNSWVDRVGILMRNEIAKVCKNMKDTLDDGKTIRESTLERTRETIKRLKSMNFIEDKQVSEMLADLEKSIPGSSQRDIPQIMSGFNAALGSIIDEAGDLSDVSEFTGIYKRKFIL